MKEKGGLGRVGMRRIIGKMMKSLFTYKSPTRFLQAFFSLLVSLVLLFLLLCFAWYKAIARAQ